MKRRTLFMLALAVLLCLAGCKGKDKEPPKRGDMDALRAAEVGSYIYFGEYEQDNDESTGKEAIEWLVLDKQDDKMLVISRYGLDCKPYNTEYEEITWETCSLRSWLNGAFYETAFIPEEKNVILPSSLSDIPEPISADMTSPVNDGEIDTDEYTIRFLNLFGTAVPTAEDRVFLLSIEEASRYFTDYDARKCVGTPYCYAESASRIEKIAENAEGMCCWLLRTSVAGHYAYVIDPNGYSSVTLPIYEVFAAVRPAMWIDLSNGEKPNTEPIAEANSAPVPKESKFGNTVTFGHFDDANEWIVLDEKENKLLLLSKYAICQRAYNDTLENVTWSTCTLRNWLNTEYLTHAFSTGELELIADTHVINVNNSEYGTPGGEDTTDKVFLLSMEEVEKYFEKNDPRVAATLTDGTSVLWWLRAFGGEMGYTELVLFPLEFIGSFVNYPDGGVRPAMWIDASSIPD
jgi:hypothetical protein